MELQYLDSIRAQAGEAALNRSHHVLRLNDFLFALGGEFRSQVIAVAGHTLKRPSQDGFTIAVPSGGIEDIHPNVERPLYETMNICLRHACTLSKVARPAGANAKQRYPQTRTSQRSIEH